MTTHFGIDLGTTYSAIAFVNKGIAEIIGEGSGLVPSVVYFGEKVVLAGEAAKKKGQTDGGEEVPRIVTCVKRQMPTAKPDERDYFQRPYGSDGEFGGKTYTPTEVSAEILRKLKEETVKHKQADIKKVVITIPAFFESDARQRTKEAGAKGLGLTENDIVLLEEPVAAAFHYASEKKEDIKGKTFLVYDLGGGTFDITVLSVEENPQDTEKTIYRVISTEGNHSLGGADWDKKIIEFFKKEFQKETGVEYSEANAKDKADFHEWNNKLCLEVEESKKTLSESAVPTVTQTVRLDEKRVKITLKRKSESDEEETFDKITRPLLEETFLLTDIVISKAREKGITRIDKLLLVGGSTLMLQVKEGLLQQYASEPLLQGVVPVFHEPNKAVAKGAALYAHRWAVSERLDQILIDTGRGGQKSTTSDLQQVASEMGMSMEEVQEAGSISFCTISSQSFGVKLLKSGVVRATSDEDNYIHNLIQKDSPKPCRGESLYSPSADGQTVANVAVYGNDIEEKEARMDASEIKDELIVTFVRPMNRNEKCIKIEIEMDEEGILHLHGSDTRGGERQSKRIDPNIPYEKKKKNT